MHEVIMIAIDGPVGAGKSEISSKLANELNILYLYTGAMYRSLAWACLNNGISPDDEEQVIKLVETLNINLLPKDENSKYPVKAIVNSIEVTGEIFSREVDQATPIVSSIAEVRRYMVDRQQKMAEGRSVVMEGRDIALRVLPNAQLKIYLTATLEERARRRWEQNKQKGRNQSLEEVIEDTKKRDLQDTNRVADPLRKMPDSWELDTTGLTQAEVIEKIKEELRRRHLI